MMPQSATPTGRPRAPRCRRIYTFLAVTTALVSLPTSSASFTAVFTNTSTLPIRSAFPDYVTAIGETPNAGGTLGGSDRGPNTYYRADTASAGTSAVDAGTIAADASGNARDGAYAGATNGPSLWWPVDEAAGSSLTPRAGGTSGLLPASGAAWRTGTQGRPVPTATAATSPALSLTGADAGGVVGSGPALDPSRSFTVSAWLWLDASTPADQTAVTQDSISGAGVFSLGLSQGSWSFGVADDSTTTTPAYQRATGAAAGAQRWTHVVGVYDATVLSHAGAPVKGSVTLYVDGAQAGATAYRPAAATWLERPTAACACPFALGRLGRSGGNVEQLVGSLDDVLVFPRALSGADIGALADSTPAPATQWRFTDTPAGTWNGVTFPTRSTADDVTARALTIGSTASALDVGLPTPAGDDGAGNGAGLSLDGSPGAHASSSGAVLPLGADARFTVSAWVRPSGSNTSEETYLSQDMAKAAYFSLGRSGSSFYFEMATSDTANPVPDRASIVWPSPMAYTDRWVHLVAVYDGINVNLWVDGADRQTFSYHAPFTGAVAGDLQIGRRRSTNTGNVTSYTSAARVAVDDVVTFDRALGLSDILQLHQHLLPTRLGPIAVGALGCLDGVQKTSMHPSTAVAFSGAADASSPAYTFGADSSVLSIELWFRAGRGGVGSLATIASDRTSPASAESDRKIYLDDAGHVRFGVWTAATEFRQHVITSPGSYQDGRCHHVVATMGVGITSPTTRYRMRLYIDGEQVAAYPATASATASDYIEHAQSYASTTPYWRWGGGRIAGYVARPRNDYFVGDLDELAVYNSELTPQQILWHFHSDH